MASEEKVSKRRSRGEGSIVQVKKKGVDGARADKWMGRVTIAPGRRRTVYAATKSECLDAMRSLKDRAMAGSPLDMPTQKREGPRYFRLQTTRDGKTWRTLILASALHNKKGLTDGD